MILSCYQAMIEEKKIHNQSDNAQFQAEVIEKKHQNSVYIEMKKKEDFSREVPTINPSSNSTKKSSLAQKTGKIWMLLLFISMIGGLTFLFLIRKSIENIHQEIISLHQDLLSWSNWIIH